MSGLARDKEYLLGSSIYVLGNALAGSQLVDFDNRRIYLVSEDCRILDADFEDPTPTSFTVADLKPL